MKFVRHALLACFALSSVFGAEADNSQSAALRERIIAHARTVSAEDYAYTRTVSTEQIGEDKPETRVIVERWDPTRTTDQRWTLVAVDGRPPKADELKDYSKSLPKRRQAYYGRVAGYFAKPATSEIDAHGKTVFHFASLPKDTVMVADTDLSANATGEATVNATGAVPFIEEVRFRSTKSTRVKLIAKIESFETMTRYRLMPDGKPVPSELTSEMSGSMLGQAGRIRTRITYSDLRAVAK